MITIAIFTMVISSVTFAFIFTSTFGIVTSATKRISDQNYVILQNLTKTIYHTTNTTKDIQKELRSQIELVQATLDTDHKLLDIIQHNTRNETKK